MYSTDKRDGRTWYVMMNKNETGFVIKRNNQTEYELFNEHKQSQGKGPFDAMVALARMLHSSAYVDWNRIYDR